jgi:peptidoglycan hydrolase FlgJ
MRQTLDPDSGLFPGDTGDVQGGLFDLYLGKHLADIGGVGMAAALERNLRNTYAPAAERGPLAARRPAAESSAR